MAVTGGGNRRDLRPLEQRSRNVLGSHSRQYEGLNVPNPQPGKFYFHVQKKNDGVEGPIRRAINEGAHFVREGDPEAVSLDPEELPVSLRQQMSVDSLKRFGDLALMWKSEKVHREEVEELRRRNAVALGGAESSYLQEGEHRAAETGSAARGESLYYVNRKKGHGYLISEEER